MGEGLERQCPFLMKFTFKTLYAVEGKYSVLLKVAWGTNLALPFCC